VPVIITCRFAVAFDSPALMTTGIKNSPALEKWLGVTSTLMLLLSLSLSLKLDIYLSSYDGLKFTCQFLGALAVRLKVFSLSVLFLTSRENSNFASFDPP